MCLQARMSADTHQQGPFQELTSAHKTGSMQNRASTCRRGGEGGKGGNGRGGRTRQHLKDSILGLLASMQGPAPQHILALLEQLAEGGQDGRLLRLQMEGHLPYHHILSDICRHRSCLAWLTHAQTESA